LDTSAAVRRWVVEQGDVARRIEAGEDERTGFTRVLEPEKCARVLRRL
jgi:hypothetical protein